MEIDRGPVRTGLDNPKLKIETMPRQQGNWKSKANMSCRSVNGNVRFTIYTNPQDGERMPDKVEFNFDPIIVRSWFEATQDVFDNNKPAVSLLFNDHDYTGQGQNRQRSQEVTNKGHLTFGKDAEGVYSIMATHKSLPDPLLFILKPDRYWGIGDPYGTPLSVGEMSRYNALGWLGFVKDTMTQATSETAAVKRIDDAGKNGKPKDKQSLGMYEGSQKPSKSQGGGQSSQSGGYQKNYSNNNNNSSQGGGAGTVNPYA